MAPNGHGQSEKTYEKEGNFHDAIEDCLDLSFHGKAGGWPYWHIDLNAGCGWNEAAACEGSPLVFLRAAIGRKRRFNACFCDRDKAALADLRGRALPLCPAFAPDCWLTFDGRNNAEALAAWGQKIAVSEKTKYAVGSVLCDPNGFRDRRDPRAGLPVEALRRFAAIFPRIDLIFSLNISLFRFVGGHKEKQHAGFLDWPTAWEAVMSLGRPHWLVSNFRDRGKGHRFVVLLGRTSEEVRQFRHFYPTDSARGREVLQNLRTVRPDQPSFEGWEDIP